MSINMTDEEVNILLNCVASMAHSLSNISKRLDQMAGDPDEDEDEENNITLDGRHMGGERVQGTPL